jgi:hypothetical protein
MVQVHDTAGGAGPTAPAAGAAGLDHGGVDGERDGRPGTADAVVLAWASSVPAPARRAERGMVSAEWAVGIVAAVAIAGVLLAVVTSGEVKAALLGIVLKVLSTFLKFAH